MSSRAARGGRGGGRRGGGGEGGSEEGRRRREAEGHGSMGEAGCEGVREGLKA